MKSILYDKTTQAIENTLRNPLVLIVAALVLGAAALVPLWMLFPYYRWLLSDPFWFPIIVMGVMLKVILTSTAVCILAERKLASFTQDRHGPNRVGFWGLLQPMADGLKFFLKEDITPANVDKPIFMLAPVLALITALIGFAIIPWAGDVHWPWMPEGEVVRTQVASLNIGILYMLAVGSLGVYGIVLGGYASNNKYSFFGGMRATAQMISYELPLGLALLSVLLVSGTVRPELIVDTQATTGMWYVFYQPIAFFIVLVCTFAEANRTPFDLAEAEQELVGGFHTEYSSMKFAMFFLGEYAHIVTGSAIMVALFFGGWHCWGLTSAADTSWIGMLIKLNVYFAKVAAFVLFFMLIRWTIPRFRFDQLMRICWLGLVPLGIALLAGTAILVALGWQHNLWASLGMNLVLLVLTLIYTARSTVPVTGRQTDLPEIQVRPA